MILVKILGHTGAQVPSPGPGTQGAHGLGLGPWAPMWPCIFTRKLETSDQKYESTIIKNVLISLPAAIT